MTTLAEARKTKTRRLIQTNREESDFFPFTGGLNLIDSPLSVTPGQVQAAINYEMGLAGGYKRVGGYEPFDGSPSASEATYNLLGFGGAETVRLSQTVNDTIDGDTSSASGQYLTQTETGGYGINLVESNQAFDTADWTINGSASVSFVDIDYVWISSSRAVQPSDLSKVTESVDVSSLEHSFQKTNNDIDVAIGDLVYVSFYARYDSSREGVTAKLSNVTAWGGAFTGITYSIKRGTVITAVDHIVDSGIELQDSGVYLCWFLTAAADAVEVGMTLRFSMMKEIIPPDSYGLFYQGDGSHLHIGGPMTVVLPFDAPHNLFNGRIFGGNTHWSNTAAGLTITDADLAWASGPYPDFSKIAETVDGSDRTHFMRSTKAGNLTPMKTKVGDKLWCELYVQYTSGQREGIYVVNDGATGFTNPTYFYFDAANGVLDASLGKGSGIENFEVTDLGGGIYRIQWTTEVAVSAANFGWNVYLFNGTGIVYTGTGLYIHVTGFRAQSFPTSVVLPGDTVRLGYRKNVSTAQNAVHTGDLVLGGLAGTPFTDGEDLSFSTSVIAQGIGIEAEDAETDPALDSTYTALAVANATSSLAPPGAGAVRGVWFHLGICYAFRDNIGATQCDMWKSTGGGWVQVTLNDVVHFDAGDGTEPAEGATLDGVTSTASALIKRVVKTSGTWGVDAAGYFVLGTVTAGPYSNNEVLNVSAVRVADADGASAVPTLTAGGRYEFRSFNFYGHSDRFRMYGVDGKNFAFEYDSGEGVFTQIETGMTVDTPIHLAAHNGHLFLGFPGGSVQLSGDGSPLSWTVITGATEIAVGDEISGFNEEVGNSLFVFTRNRSYVLQGNTRANFDLDDFNVNAGAHEWSLQRIGLGTFFDDRGFTTLLQTQRSGSVNFQENTQSELIQPLVSDLAANAQVKCSHLIRNENIYRCYFDDGRIVSIGFAGHKVSGHMPVEYNFVANCAVSEEDTDGSERLFIGADDGFVYELQTGTSFDGDPIRSFMRTVLYHSKSPGRMKKYNYARVDASLSGALTLSGQVEYDFHEDGWNLADELDFSTDEAGGYWDDMAWDAFVWDKPTSGIPQEKLEGEGVNAAIYLHSTSTIDKPHTLRGVSLQWAPRRDDRRV